MKYFSRPYQTIGAVLIAGALAGAPFAHAQMTEIRRLFQQVNPLLSHSSSQGYLGVLVGDVDTETAAKLKLKDTHGAVITLIDHDAPAGQVGLRINDVVVGLNGQNVDGAEQFGRMLREIPAGHKIAIVISREGAQQTFQVQLVDHKTMAHDVWNKLNSEDNFPPPPTGMGYMTSGDPIPSMHMALFTSSLHVGAAVEPLTAQMADYLGVQNGIMVKQVAHKSEAAAAGLKAYDIILKVGNDPITTTADWDRSLRVNEGKSVPVTILRERKQQVVNLQVDSKHHS